MKITGALKLCFSYLRREFWRSQAPRPSFLPWELIPYDFKVNWFNNHQEMKMDNLDDKLLRLLVDNFRWSFEDAPVDLKSHCGKIDGSAVAFDQLMQLLKRYGHADFVAKMIRNSKI